ncbi:hypothetical protein QUF76_00275 [Desulfobacterales bacterium HSG16]|nr:hypothetical protein [Desulfobacterales bacterium HSG16]
MNYKFPITNRFQARTVTESSFEISPTDSRIYVSLDRVRGREYIERIKYNLNIDKHQVQELTGSFEKIVLSGHKGCGKSIELKRLQNYVDDSIRYFSVFIDIEKEFPVADFMPEDLLVILISSLLIKTGEESINFDSVDLNDILYKWLSAETVKKELEEACLIDLSRDAAFLKFAKNKSAFKSAFLPGSKIAETIREINRKNPFLLIDKFNAALYELRFQLRELGRGKDIMFIIDGSPKIPIANYKRLFCENSYLIKGIDANIVFSVPVNACFDIKGAPSADFFKIFKLPVVPVTPKTVSLLAQVVDNRIDADSFLEKDALDYCIEKSGGCVGQLMQIVNRALVISLGQKITKETAVKSADELGREILELLDAEHLKLLAERKFDIMNAEKFDLFTYLAVIEVDGKRKINPLIEDMGI